MKAVLMSFRYRVSWAALALCLSACASLLPTPPAPPTLHLLIGGPTAVPLPQAPTPASLRINPPRAVAGFDSRRIVYLREPYRLDYFAKHEWVDTPARMLAPLLLSAWEAGGRYRVVLGGHSAGSAEFSLDTELIRLQQDFSQSPSQVRLTLRASLLDNTSRRVLASREFDARVAAPSDDAGGGVIAANLAVQQVSNEMVRAPEFARLAAGSP